MRVCTRAFTHSSPAKLLSGETARTDPTTTGVRGVHCQPPFRSPEGGGGGGSALPPNVGVMLKHRLRPPPTEVYSLHRRLSGLYLGCAQIGASLAVKPRQAVTPPVVDGHSFRVSSECFDPLNRSF